MEKNRLETLIDGIFAIVMTILVMTVVVPQREVVISGIGFKEMLQSKVHDIFNYALSFSLLAIFWIRHHKQAHFIKRTNQIHIWINIVSMFFIALLPFSTSLVTEFPDQDPAEVVFGVNLLTIGLLFLLNWTYATRKRHLVDQNISDREIKAGRNDCFFFILIALVSIFLSQAHPSITADIFWIIPLLVFSEHLFKKRTRSV